MTNKVLVESKSFVSQIIGPISLICTLFLAGKAIAIPNYDLILVSIVGLYFCAKWRFQGCLVALVLLSVSAACKHLIYTDHHVWQGGFELSVAIALIITTLVFHESAKYVDGVKAQNVAQSQTIEFLEEDLIRVKSHSAEEALITSDKIIQLQSQLDEALTESSSYQILNDVLRKSTARAIEEKEQLVSQIFQSDRRSGQLLSEIDVLQKELARIGDESAVIQQNGQLFKELNEARVKEAQTHLVNDTLARMHRSENARVKTLEGQQNELGLQLQKAKQEQENNAMLVEELNLKIDALSSSAQRQHDAQNERAQFLETELEQKKTLLYTFSKQFEEVQLLNSNLSELKGTLETELEQARQQILSAPPAITPEREAFLVEQITSTLSQLESLESKTKRVDELEAQLEMQQIRLAQYTDLELLYRQLKGNFQEKTQILHETRVELFHVDTELQTLKQQIQESRLDVEPVIPEMTAEIEEIEQENKALTLENSLLNEIVTQLMSSTRESHVPLADAVTAELNHADAGLVKKKVKKQKVLAEQQDLFFNESF